MQKPYLEIKEQIDTVLAIKPEDYLKVARSGAMEGIKTLFVNIAGICIQNDFMVRSETLARFFGTAVVSPSADKEEWCAFWTDTFRYVELKRKIDDITVVYKEWDEAQRKKSASRISA